MRAQDVLPIPPLTVVKVTIRSPLAIILGVVMKILMAFVCICILYVAALVVQMFPDNKEIYAHAMETRLIIQI